MNVSKIFFAILIIGTFSFCKGKTLSDKERMGVDLLKYGIPFVIYSPEGANIRSIVSNKQYNVSINNGKDYDVQILMSDAIINNVETLKAQKKTALVANPYFNKIIEERDEGFIYEKLYEDVKGYDFYLLKIQGNHELSFQCGSSGIFSESEVKRMMDSVLKGF